MLQPSVQISAVNCTKIPNLLYESTTFVIVKDIPRDFYSITLTGNLFSHNFFPTNILFCELICMLTHVLFLFFMFGNL